MKKSALIIHGGWEGHEPHEGAKFWAEVLRQEGIEVEVSDTLRVLEDHDRVKTFDLIVPNWTMGEISKEQVQGLEAATEAGSGIAGFHGGMGDAFRGNVSYLFITGCQFLSHPDNVKEWKVNIVKGTDPIVEGIGDFTIKSEQYYMLVDPNNEVLAETTFHPESAPWLEGNRMPVVMKRRHRKSRVFYCAIGHKVHEFAIPEVKEIQRRGFLWAIR